jgi:hypothetical protein
MNERKLIEQMIRDTEESIRYFSSPIKPEREVATCAAFLRCLGLNFNISDLGPVEQDPPDVQFKSASFEIKEYVDDDRRRHDEYKKLLSRLKKAKKLNDLIEPFSPPQPLTIKDVCNKLAQFLGEYARMYGKSLCSSLDALVYFNLMGYYVDNKNILADISQLKAQCWRSVSIISNSVAYIFYASTDAPDFLRANVDRFRKEWTNSGLFDLT